MLKVSSLCFQIYDIGGKNEICVRIYMEYDDMK